MKVLDVIILTTFLFLMVCVVFVKTNTLQEELAQVQEELVQAREIAEKARLNTHINAECLQTVKRHWGGPRHEQLEFMAEVTTNQGGK